MSALSGIRKGRRLPWLTGYDQAPLAEEVPAVALRGGSRRTERCHVRWLGAVGPERAGPPGPGAGSESRPGDWRHAAPSGNCTYRINYLIGDRSALVPHATNPVPYDQVRRAFRERFVTA
jgi:hypothetical protein